MKWMTYCEDGGYKIGICTAGGILPWAEANRKAGRPEWASFTMEDILGEAGPSVTDVEQWVSQEWEDLGQLLLNESELTLGPCVPRPGKIICVGLNYRKHAAETGLPVPAHPVLFSKFANSIAAAGQPIRLPEASSKVDYEAELAMVIGKRADHVKETDALDYVYGYCNANDVSARDLQMLTSQWLLGKSCDGFCPIGPYLVTADEIADPNNLGIRAVVNGELRQNSNTNDMIFDCKTIIAFVSRHMSLEPGDVILTGTPEGVIMGYPAEKQVYLRDGDTVTVEIEQLGSLTNRFVRSRRVGGGLEDSCK